ncbi:hypothetical protein ST47_g4789 [Ascochyta rabiei]|uniref:Uncharacterized protein n=1 Tax=Didymella rabiei TaxID=5454 RepID=A0A163F224_DIDRA|nr:hypothetical protein ST47_g4789 [Ascochyta rabiei]
MKGAGVFQDEFDNCDLLLFELVRVDRAYRRRGLAIPVDAVYEWSEGLGRGYLFNLYPVSDEESLHTMPNNKLLRVVSSCLGEVSTDDPRWHITYHPGSNILHFAAAGSKVLTVNWLLKHNSELRDQHTMAGQTALDKLEAELEEFRT